MYTKKVLSLAEHFADKGVLLTTPASHPMRHVETGPEGQVFGTDFINERAPKVVNTMRLFKYTIIPVLNTTIQKVTKRVSDIKMELNEQELIKIYNVSEKYEALNKDGYIFKEEVKGFCELTFNEMKAEDIVEMEPFGKGALRDMSLLTPERTSWIYDTYIKAMNKVSCKNLLDLDACADTIDDRIDTIIVLLRILNGEVVGGVFTPDKPRVEDALSNNVRILINLQMNFVELYNRESEVLGSVKNGKISLFPAGLKQVEECDRVVRGLALEHEGYFTKVTLEKKDYRANYNNHLAIKALQNNNKLLEYKKDIIKHEISKLEKLGSEFTSRMDDVSFEDIMKYIDETGEISDIKRYITSIFNYQLFYKLPLGDFLFITDELLKQDPNLSMESAAVLATAELIIDDIMVGIKSTEIGV